MGAQVGSDPILTWSTILQGLSKWSITTDMTSLELPGPPSRAMLRMNMGFCLECKHGQFRRGILHDCFFEGPYTEIRIYKTHVP